MNNNYYKLLLKVNIHIRIFKFYFRRVANKPQRFGYNYIPLSSSLTSTSLYTPLEILMTFTWHSLNIFDTVLPMVNWGLPHSLSHRYYHSLFMYNFYHSFITQSLDVPKLSKHVLLHSQFLTVKTSWISTRVSLRCRFGYSN